MAGPRPVLLLPALLPLLAAGHLPPSPEASSVRPLGVLEVLLAASRQPRAAARLTGGPFLAPAWSAAFSEAHGTSPNQGQMYHDRANQRMRQFHVQHKVFFTQDDVHRFDMLSVSGPGLNFNITVGLGDDAICKAASMPYVDPFAVFALAEPNGSSVVDGVPCDIWAVQTSTPSTGPVNISACIAADGVPREVNQSSGSMVTLRGRDASNSTIRFANVSVGPQPDAVFAMSEACATRYPTPPCPATGTSEDVVDLVVYRIHGASEPLVLSDRNVGDDLGDMAFVCATDFLTNYNISRISLWTLQANRSYGQYAYCNFRSGGNVCMGGTGALVGRQAAMGFGTDTLQGQCSVNDDVGNWFSLPASGECAPGRDVGAGGCTWGRAVRKRTVAASCILDDRGLKEVCAQEVGHAPFSRSAAVFRAALASPDPAAGGCPDISAVPPADGAEVDVALLV